MVREKKKKYLVSSSCVGKNMLLRSEENEQLVGDDGKTTATQVATRYNQGMQNTISECTTCGLLKQLETASGATVN